MGSRVALAAPAFVLAATFCWQAPPLGHEASPAPLSSDLVQALTAEPGPTPNDDLVFGEMKVPRWLAEAVVRAAQATNVDPAYLMALADKESSLLPDNKARTSSAEGLFQFIETTWLEVFRRYGPKHGHAAEAEAIQIVESRPAVSDAKQREAILGLRRDPYLSALMAGEMINTHREILAGKTARDPSFAELYMAHFLGVQGARRFMELLSDSCHFAERFGRWVGDLAVVLVRGQLGTELKAVRSGPGFECRKRNRAASGKLSAHALGLAVDISGFELASGDRLLATESQHSLKVALLSALRTASCGWFTTILGPGTDATHADHCHLDIQHHGSSVNYRICQ